MGICDTHCHLDSEAFSEDLSEVLARAFNGGIDKIIIPAADINTLPKAVELTNSNEKIFFAVGIHPLECENKKNDFALLEKLITHPKCVAVGECGYDYFYHKEAHLKQKQKELFERQIELAYRYKKPLIIHSREANNDTFQTLKAFIDRTKGEFRKGHYGVLHCFNASEHLLGLKDHFYFGIGGVLTFKNAKNLAEILPKIPKNKLLLETDAPYLTPEPHRGKKNEPFYTNLVANKLASLLECSLNEVQRFCEENTTNLFFKDY